METQSQKDEIIKFITEFYGDNPEYLWAKTPDFAVFRHQTNQKWYALIMTVPYNRLGVKNNETVDIINLKCDHIMLGSLLEENGFYPAYHMSKTHWVTAALDGNVDINKIKTLIDISYDLTNSDKVKSKQIS